MKNVSIKYLLILLSLGSSFNVEGQSFPDNLNIGMLQNGYKERVSGETASYYSSNPDVNTALVARNSSHNNAISWKTANIPANYKGEYIYFVWLAGLATGKNRQNSSYDFYINNKKALNIKVITQKFPQTWSLKGEGGLELDFIQGSLDDNKDCFGFMYLKVPVNSYKKGSPLLLEMKGKNNDRYDDWYITYQYAVKESALVGASPLLRKDNNEMQQLVAIHINHIWPKPVNAFISVGKDVKKELLLKQGSNDIECWVPATKVSKDIPVNINVPGYLSLTKQIKIQPVTKRQVYLIPNSHTDIGYSNLQPIVAKEHAQFIREAIKIIDTSKYYPKNAQFKWNVESMWSVYNFLEDANEQEREEFIADVKNGYIGLSAGYINLLTAVCRPEELIHWTDYSDTLHRKYGINFKSLMMSDVPGMSWNVVSALSQRGVRYVSDGPNYIPFTGFPDFGGRVGATHRAEGDKPFYWISPSRKDTILYWQAGKGYSWFHDWIVGRLGTQKSKDSLLNYMQELENRHYPYDMVQLRYCIISDNQSPDPNLPNFVSKWNKKYISPRLVISTVDNMMETFERRYRDKLPVKFGDFTPYWEDGVMSSAKEEVLVKHSVERLDQSAVLATLLSPGDYDRKKYCEAWRDVIMWHEHTWGASNSISEPDNPLAIKQWKYKQNFALQADSLSLELLEEALGNYDTLEKGITVFNTSSWKRTNLVILTKEQSTIGDVIVDGHGKVYPSQRLSDGSLAFLAKDIPSLGNQIFYNKSGKSSYKSDLIISGDTIEDGAIRLVLDRNTGAIKNLIDKGNNKEFVDVKRYKGLNQYIYMPGTDPAKAVSVNNVTIKIKEKGPLISTFEISSEAPGTHGLIQDISLINELNKIEITDVVDKSKVRNKESVHFAFPFYVPGGQMRVDLGTAVMRPELDQLRGANKDYFCMQRWVDISNDQEGITFVSREVPLIEEGKLVNEMLYDNSKTEKRWKEHASISNTFFSYAMNNYWYTNYKADQEGKVVFHYALFFHNKFDQAKAARHGMEDSQPLLITTAKPKNELPFSINDKNILLTSFTPSKSGRGYFLRFYNASSHAQRLELKWTNSNGTRRSKIYLSDANDDILHLFDLKTLWPPHAVKTLYIE